MIETNITKKHQFQTFATLHHYITMLTFTCVFVGGLFLWIAATRLEVHHSIKTRKYIERHFDIPTEIKETHLLPLQEVFTTESSLQQIILGIRIIYFWQAKCKHLKVI